MVKIIKIFVHIGQRVSVNGYMMNVHSRVCGGHTLVLMSGGVIVGSVILNHIAESGCELVL